MATAVPAAITSWLKQTYPNPRVDQVWLGECYQWLLDELQINPRDTKRATDAVEEALLDSDLKDSTQPGTGFPENIAATNTTVQGPSILVQIVDIAEIGHSAFSLTNVRQTRLDQEDLAGLARQDEEENENQDPADEDVGPIPKYPRSMLKLHLSDGSVTVPAIEFKRIPGLELGVTPLGCKLLLKDFSVHGGIIFLNPKCVIVKGGRVEEKVAIQDELFLAGLRARMGLHVDESAELAAYRAAGNLKLPVRVEPQSGPTNNGNPTRKRKAPAKNATVKNPTTRNSTTRNPTMKIPTTRTLTTRNPSAKNLSAMNPPARDQPPGNAPVEKSRFFVKPKPEVTASQLMKNGVFSPLTRATTIIEIESDEEKRRSSTVNPTRPKRQETSVVRTETEYSFEGDDFMNNPDFFQELDRVETTVLSQQFPPSVSAGPSQIRNNRNPTHQTYATHSDTIEVDTDKENEPESKRRVRKRIAAKKGAAAPNQSVISIEDSD